MDEGERERVQNWLVAEDNAHIVLLTVSSFALAVASILLWRAKHVENNPGNHHGSDSQQTRSAQSIITAALSTFHIASNTPGECDMTQQEHSNTPKAPFTSADMEQKASRSKERRRRGKVPHKELLKGGKKAKSTPKIIQSKMPLHQDNSGSDSPVFESESRSTTSNDNIAPVASSTSRLPSPTQDPPQENLVSHLSVESPPAVEPHEDRLLPACMLASSSEPASVLRHVTSNNPYMHTSRSEHTHLHGAADHIQPVDSPCHDDPSSMLESSSPTTSTEEHDSHDRASSFTSCPQSRSMPLRVSMSTHTLDLDGQLQACRAGAHIKPPRLMSEHRGTDKSNGGCVISASVSHTTPLAPSSAFHCSSPARITLSTSASASSSPLHPNFGSSIEPPPSPSGSSPPSPTLPHVTFPTLNLLQASPNDHTHTHSSTVESPIMNGHKVVGPPIPTASRGSTPPPGVPLHTVHIGSPTGPLRAQTQLASMRGALEAARLREEKARMEAERVGKENEELKWRLNEDTMAWRRREAELQAQVHHLMQQLQAAYSVFATLQSQAQAQAQAQSPSSSYSSPTSPSPRLQPHSPNISHNGLPLNFNHNPPAHVQALLASSYHPYPGFPGTYGGAGMTPFFSGLRMTMNSGSSVRNGGGIGQYTPDTISSAGSSPSRGRQRRRNSASSSAQENNSENMGMSEAEEDQEDMWQNSILADAILKRPESLRVPSRGSLRSDGRMSAIGSGTSGKEDAERVPSRMSERSDASASGGSYGALSMSSLSSGKSEDETSGVIAERDSILAEVTGVTNNGGEGTSGPDLPTQDALFWNLSTPAPARDVQ
ncbi:uncharacterized protein EDB93DRAFT_1337216 [Suillus bovinus]|uniref:uncharacterized protein n=1 Tax=Suillus bovinus TaxID=48563 RepID=UPI001B868D56|nr:uncharacterized protein EDB93DRAFT_1337216 [Suillus bovinus]KAG2148208.1 hypothetical protein EDB93DRAFT_1337216 [Suillus bovinus]